MPSKNLKLAAKLKKIRMLLLDVDGVLTDGRIMYGMLGLTNINLLIFDAHDGFGIRRAIESGLRIGVITGRTSKIVKRRVRELGIMDFYQGYNDKLPAFEKIKRAYGLKDDKLAYLGDDLLDLQLLEAVGFSAAPKTALPEVKNVVDYVTKADGGRGAVREVIDLILRAQGKIG